MVRGAEWRQRGGVERHSSAFDSWRAVDVKNFPNKRERACMYVHERLQGRLDKPRGARHSLTEVLGDVAPPLVGRRASYDTGGVLKRHGHYTKTRKRCESFITPPTVLKRLGRFETPPRFIAAFAFSNMPERFKTGGVFHDIWGV